MEVQLGQPLVQAAAAPINHTHLRVLRGVFSAGRRYAVTQSAKAQADRACA